MCIPGKDMHSRSRPDGQLNWLLAMESRFRSRDSSLRPPVSNQQILDRLATLPGQLVSGGGVGALLN